MEAPDTRMEASKHLSKLPKAEKPGDALALAGTQTTLVKYDTPFLIATHELKKEKLSQLVQPHDKDTALSAVTGVVLSAPGYCAGDSAMSKKETEEILNAILPPRQWRDEAGNLWRQTVSTVPATRQDVISLEEQLNMRLKQMQARETGICPIRRELYAQTFDELIRQVTINCAERGILLLRVRDEIYMTLEAYRTLYESSTAYGMRKALMAESGKSDLEAKIKEMHDEKESLEAAVADLQSRMDAIQTKFADQKQSEEVKHAEEIAFLKKANNQIKQQLEAIVAPKKA